MLPASLPPLREDLQLHAAAPNHDGSPAWTIQDPVNNAFYRIGWLEFELLSRWHLVDPQAVLEDLRATSPLDPSEEELLALVEFLQGHHLLVIRSPAFTDHLATLARRASMSRANWLLHHYLYFRIPLWHPDRLLQALLSHLGWIYTRSFAAAVTTLCVAGLALTARQWDTFAAAVVDTFSPAGLVGYFLALAVAKSLHEFGHALTATRYGVRVAHMGVAFLVMWPVLYTDTGESWRLRDRRQRLAIASAGIVTELALAGLATLAWNLTEQPELKGALLFLATTAWLLSLSINASPFMRFDGYFILSDAIDMPNLHERAFALARVWMRNRLLGWNDAEPEALPPRQRAFLIAFALLTWLYRLVVFVGIAVAVYYYFFKLLGIFLFAVEIGWFVIRPIRGELKIWSERREEIRQSRKRAAWAALGACALVGLVPWNATVTAPAWIHAETVQTIYSPLPARVVTTPPEGGRVAAGDVLFAFEQPELETRRRQAASASDALDVRLAGLAALPEGEEKRVALLSERDMHAAESAAQRDEQERLVLRASHAGVLTDTDDTARPGVWVNPRQPLGALVAPGAWRAEVFVGQQDFGRVTVGDRIRFYAHADPLLPLTGTITGVDRVRISRLPSPLLSARHGGDIAVLPDESAATPRDALYRVTAKLDGAPEIAAQLSGTAVIDGSPRSWLVEAMKTVLTVVVREATF